MAYIDAYPDAINVKPTDIVVLGQGGIPNVPGSATTKQATLAQLFLGGGGSFLPLIGGTVTGATTFSAGGTGLQVTANQIIGGTLGVTGTTSLGTTALSGSLTVTNVGPTGILVQNTGAAGAGNYTSATIKSTGASAFGPALVLDGAGITGGHVFSLISTGNLDGGGVGVGKWGIFDNTSGAFRMVIDGSGHVGINKLTPGYQLEVNGNFAAAQAAIGGGTTILSATSPTPTISSIWNWGGTTAGVAHLNILSVTDTLDTTASPGSNAEVLYLASQPGAGATGARTGLSVLIQPTTNTGALSMNALDPQVNIKFDISLGNVWSYGGVSQVTGSGTNVNQLNGVEQDIGIRSGAAVNSSSAIFPVLLATHRQQPSGVFNAYGMAAQTGAIGLWKTGIDLGSPVGLWPIDNTSGVLIKAWAGTNPGAASLVLGGIDLLQAVFPAFTSQGFAFRSNGFAVDGSGSARLGYAYLSQGSGSLIIDVQGSIAISATVNAGGTGYITNDIVEDLYGGLWTVTASGGVVSAVAIYQGRASTYPTTSAPTTGITTKAMLSHPGTGLTINITWGTGTTLSIQPSGGTLKVGSALMSANGTVATALSSVGPAGSHTTVQEWLTVTNAAGSIRYIPAF